MAELTKSQKGYLKTIYELSSGLWGARVTDVAHSLGVSKASVSVTVVSLENGGFVRRDSNRHIVLTGSGKKVAQQMVAKHKVIYHFLTNKLHVNPQIALEEADAIEHFVGEQTVAALRQLVENE